MQMPSSRREAIQKLASSHVHANELAAKAQRALPKPKKAPLRRILYGKRHSIVDTDVAHKLAGEDDRRGRTGPTERRRVRPARRRRRQRQLGDGVGDGLVERAPHP